MTGTGGARRRKVLVVAGALALFLLSMGAALFYTLPRETLLLMARTSAGRAGFTFDARSASTRFPATVRFDNVTLHRAGSSVPLLVERAELGLHPVGIFFGAPLRVTLSRGAGTIDSGSTLAFTRGKVAASALTSADFSIPAASGFTFRLDDGECTWSRSGTGGAGTGTLRFRELRFPLPEGQGSLREALLRDVTVKFTVSGTSLRVSSLAGSYEDTSVEGTGELVSLFGAGETTITAQLRVVNPLSGRVAALFDMAAKNARNATFRLTGPLRAPRGELQLF